MNVEGSFRDEFTSQRVVNIDAKNKKGRIPLIQASYNGKFEVVKFLMTNKADIFAKDNSGRTALDYAKIKKHDCIAQYIMENLPKKKNLPKVPNCLLSVFY